MNIETQSFDKAFFEGRYQTHPQCPIAVRDLWLEQDMFTSKYIIAVMDCHADKIIPWLAEQVHLLCCVEDDNFKIDSLKHTILEYNKHNNYSLNNISYLKRNSFLHTIDSDVMDFIVLGQKWLHEENKHILQKDLQNILRLNSYVSLCLHEIKLMDSNFGIAYAQLLKQYQLQDDYQITASNTELADFFNNQYAVNSFANQLRFTPDSWELYIKSSYYYWQISDSRRSLFLRAAKLLFAQYYNGEAVSLEFETHIYIGIFNKYTPAISLRKSIFFHVLRPFALGFYVLLKLNVYFWKMLYKLFHWNKKKPID